MVRACGESGFGESGLNRRLSVRPPVTLVDCDHIAYIEITRTYNFTD